MTTYLSIFVAIIAFSLIVIVHELGHFFAAKKNGIFVMEFALGMGPKLFSKKIGETVYSLRAFPIGGFCKMLGEDEEIADPRAFGNKKPFARFIVLVAGAVMNFIFGLFLIFVFISWSGYSTNVVGTAKEGLPAYEVGIRPGDKIVSVDGRKTTSFNDILFAMNFADASGVEVVTRSNGVTKTYELIPGTQTSEYKNETYSRFIIGITPETYAGMFSMNTGGYPRASVWGSAANTVVQFRFYVNATFEALYMLVRGNLGLGDLSGVIGIGGAFVESIEEPINEKIDVQGVERPLSDRLKEAAGNVITIMILLTINLGMMNLLPFPALDGGRAVFVIIEAVRRKPFDQDKEGLIHFVGFALLMLLMVFVTYSDIVKLFRS